jgi:hypothetical protein
MHQIVKAIFEFGLESSKFLDLAQYALFDISFQYAIFEPFGSKISSTLAIL